MARRSLSRDSTAYLMLGGLLFVCSFGAYAHTSHVLEKRAAGEPADVGGVVLLWGVALLVAASIVALAAWRRARRRGFHRAFERLRDEFGGQYAPTFDLTRAWLDDHWGGPYPSFHLAQEGGSHAFAASIGAFPCLVDMLRRPVADDLGWEYVRLLLAAPLAPGAQGMLAAAPAPGNRARQLLAELAQRGFEVTLSSGGLTAMGNAAVCAACRNPNCVVDTVAPALRLLGQLAHELAPR